MKKKAKENTQLEMTSINQWMDNYGITKYRDQEFENKTRDPSEFGATLANSTIDRLLKKRNLTITST